jgi:predicted dehydrogenase/threonine dehydrogenase-like Zn-dependent dehydrogenase
VQKAIQEMRTGTLKVSEIPAPFAHPGEILIATVASGISAGTERMVVDLAKQSILGKARERPDVARRAIEKVRHEALFTTIRQTREQLDTPVRLGYSSAGVVLACGSGVQQFKPGDRVASNGPHAEIASVSKHLCARIPPDVDFDQAAFAVLGAIALQGVRLSHADLGATVLVVGLGLIGQLTVGLLTAAGCRVIGTDLDGTKCDLARQKMGAEIARPNLSALEIESLTAGLGSDAVVITASAPSNDPISLAAAAVRKKGRVILVCDVDLELDRRPFYFKEAEFVVSCSYGPGRYDPDYEDRGHDYPGAYVRWTEQRNIHAVLELLSQRKLDVRPLISHRFPIGEAAHAYDLIERGEESFLGILLEYPRQQDATARREIRLAPQSRTGRPAIGVVGAGNFARLVLLPALRDSGRLRLATLCTSGGAAMASGRKVEFEKATTDEDEVFSDPELDAVVSLTRHDVHARHVVRGLRAGKAVFVEKPLCLTLDELAEIQQILDQGGDDAPFVMVGFNHRFSQAAADARRFFADVTTPLTAAFRFNAGPISPIHWTQEDAQGGGRIIDEACHGIDLVTFLVGSPPVRVFAESIGGPHAPSITDDQCFITLRHANGAISSVAYLAGGDEAFPKERAEVIGGGRIAVIDDFGSLTTCCEGRTSRTKYRGQDKGHAAKIEAFARTLDEGGAPPIPWEEIRSVTLASILALHSLRQGIPIDLP